ncbi:hypothetical protein OG21DRAFT_1528429 [Imleria badia]|nr:hypothetical protein OG21DRAFT_1528429 [Imleria badia]
MCRIDHATPPSQVSVAPASCGGSVVPVSRGGRMRGVDYTTPSQTTVTIPSCEGSAIASRGGSVVPVSRSRTYVPISRSASASTVSDVWNGSLTTATLALDALPSLPASGYNSDEEESQLPEHHYYGRTPVAPVNDDADEFSFESTQRRHPANGTVSSDEEAREAEDFLRNHQSHMVSPRLGELNGLATKLRSYPYKFREVIE